MISMNGTCDKCGATGASPYTFRYGKQTSVTDYHRAPVYSGSSYTGTQTTWTEHYQVGGTRTAWLCARCLLRTRATRALKILGREYFGFPLIAFVYGLFLLSLGYSAYALLTGAPVEGNAETWTWWVVATLVTPIVVYVLIFAFNPPSEVGEQTAIDMNRAALEQQGWHQFWTTKQYAKLNPERTRLPFG